MKTSNIYLRLGQKIRLLREKHELSQEELAARITVHRTYVGSIERGEKRASLEILEAIAHSLDVDLSDLFNS